MRIGWMYPHREKCGIAQYSQDYLLHFPASIDITDLDPPDFISNREHFIKSANQCDIVHIQYDTTAFFTRRRDFFPDLMKCIVKPAIVTIHDIYKEQPGVFPRSSLSGSPPVKRFREILYDLRHPFQTAFEQHRRNNFYTRNIHLHHVFHKAFLENTDISCAIHIIPLPVKLSKQPHNTIKKDTPLLLGTIGFINPLFNYGLLFEVLKRLNQPWHFTWIGGLRSSEQQPLLDSINRHIHESGWSDRFIITGWIAEEQLDNHLAALNLSFALFTQRSSSASIARALGARLPVVATRLPLTEEIASFNTIRNAPSPVLLSDSDPSDIINIINDFTTDKTVQKKLEKGIDAYCDSCSFSNCANEFITLYREIADQ